MDTQLKENIRKSKFELDVVKNLLRIGAANSPVFLLSLGMPFLIRTQIINDLGFTANGIYQAVFAISGQFLNVPLNAVGTYILPKLSQLADPKEINPEVNRAVKLVLILITFGILVILLIRDIAIHVLFSSKFLPAVALFSWQMVGDLFKSVTMTIQVPLVIQERFRARNIQHILQYGLFLLVFYLAPASNRLQGAVFAHAISWAFALIITYAYLNWLNGYKFDKANWRLMITCTIAVVAVAFLPLNSTSRLLGCGITIVWAITALSPGDWKQLIQKARNRLCNRVN